MLIEGETTKAIFLPNVDDDLQKVNTTSLCKPNIWSGLHTTPPILTYVGLNELDPEPEVQPARSPQKKSAA